MAKAHTFTPCTAWENFLKGLLGMNLIYPDLIMGVMTYFWLFLQLKYIFRKVHPTYEQNCKVA